MTYLGCRDGFSMVSVLVYVMHTRQDLRWIVMQGYQMSWFTKLLYCMDSQPWEDIESVEINKGLWLMSNTLKWSYIPMDWVTIDGGWWQ